MDLPNTSDKVQETMDLDQMVYDLGPYGNPPLNSHLNNLDNGLLQGWCSTPFQDFDPELPFQDEPNLSISPQTNWLEDTPLTTTSHCLDANDFSEAIAELDAMAYLPHYDSIYTESATLSPDSLTSGASLSAKSGASSLCGDLFAGLDSFYLSGSSLSPATIADPQPSPQPGNSSNNQVTQVPKIISSRPCDAKREKRKLDKPEICPFCDHHSAWKRDLKRHIISRHKDEAKNMRLPVARLRCTHLSCPKTFRRKDHLKRHLRNKHGEP